MENYILWLGNVIINSFPNKSLKKIMVFYIEDKSKNEGVLLPGLITWTAGLHPEFQEKLPAETFRVVSLGFINGKTGGLMSILQM
jgi:hypothetical protein